LGSRHHVHWVDQHLGAVFELTVWGWLVQANCASNETYLTLVVEELEESWKNKVCTDGKNHCGLLFDLVLIKTEQKN